MSKRLGGPLYCAAPFSVYFNDGTRSIAPIWDIVKELERRGYTLEITLPTLLRRLKNGITDAAQLVKKKES